MSGVNKITAERSQRTLLELALKPGNDSCADCKARAPRWASHNLGIFLCVQCASIHRKLGTHITKVKSLTLDSWSKEQVEIMKQNGNIKSNAYYNPNEVRNPPPTNMMESERDGELEQYIRAKYEFKKFVDRSTLVAAKLGPSRSSSKLPTRPQTTPSTSTATATAAPAAPHSFPSKPPVATRPPPAAQVPVPRSVSQPLAPTQAKPSNNPVWDDLISLQGPSQNSSVPLQLLTSTAPTGHLVSNPSPNNTNPPPNPFSSHMQMNPTGAFAGTGIHPIGTGMGGVGSSNPFQQQQQQQQQQQPLGSVAFSPGNSNTNPFNQMGSSGGYRASSGMTGMMGQPMQQSAFQPHDQPQQQPFFQPRPQPQLLNANQFVSPQPQPTLQQPFLSHSPGFMGTPSPFDHQNQRVQSQPQFGQQPSPFGQQQPSASASQQLSPFGQQQPAFSQHPSSFGQQPQNQANTWPQGQWGGM